MRILAHGRVAGSPSREFLGLDGADSNSADDEVFVGSLMDLDKRASAGFDWSDHHAGLVGAVLAAMYDACLPADNRRYLYEGP